MLQDFLDIQYLHYLCIDGVRVLLHEAGVGQHGVAPHAVLHTRVLIRVIYEIFIIYCRI